MAVVWLVCLTYNTLKITFSRKNRLKETKVSIQADAFNWLNSLETVMNVVFSSGIKHLALIPIHHLNPLSGSEIIQ
jgi:biopolymer transport protein ExbD